MADRPPDSEPGDGRPATPVRSQAPGTPLWVKVFGAISLAVIVAFVVLLLIGGGGGHGPARHIPPSGTGPGIHQR